MDSYKIAIALAMSSNHAAVLGALSSHLLGVHAKVNELQGGFNRLKYAIGGALSVTAGMTLFHTMEKLVDKTKAYSDELVKLERLGGAMGVAAANGEISKRAFDISQRVPMNVVDLMKIPGATYSIIGQEESMEHWESLAKLSFTLQSQKDYKGDPGKDLQDLIRAGEISGRITDKVTGAIDPAKLEKYLDTATRIVASTHGMVNPQTLLALSKQGGFTLRGLSEEGYYTEAIIAQALGGHRTGTAQLSLYQQMASGTMRARTAHGLEELGLLKPDEWTSDKGGGVILADGASKRLTGLIGKDPLEYAARIVEQLKTQGVTDPEEQMRRVARAHGRQTTQRYTAEQVTNFQQMLAERERMMGGMGMEGSFGTIMNKSVGANLEAMKAAWTNLLTSLSGPNGENVIKFLQTLTSSMNALQSVITHTDPNAIAQIGYGLGILAGAFTAAGIVALIAAIGPAGWLVLGIAALGGAAAVWGPQIKALAASGWEYITRGFNNLTGAITGLGAIGWEKITSGIDSIRAAISGLIEWLSGVAGKVQGLFGVKPSDAEKTDRANQGLLHLQRFDPGTSKMKAQPISLSLNVDGRTLAQVMTEQLEYLTEHATGAPSYNGQSHFGRADGGIMGT